MAEHPWCSDVSRDTAIRAAIACFVVGVSVWVSEPRGQEYALRGGDEVLFWLDDEAPVRRGVVFLLWGYVPHIVCDGRGYSFREVSWCSGGGE